MSDPIFSPDGQFMWTGSEWIPAPPQSIQSANINLKDSAIGGDINVVTNVYHEDQCKFCRSAGSIRFACVECEELCNCELCVDDYKKQRWHNSALGEEPVFPGTEHSDTYDQWDERYETWMTSSNYQNKNYCHNCYVKLMDKSCNMRCKLCDRRYNSEDPERDKYNFTKSKDYDDYCWSCAGYLSWLPMDEEYTDEFVRNFKQKVRQRSESRFLNDFE